MYDTHGEPYHHTSSMVRSTHHDDRDDTTTDGEDDVMILSRIDLEIQGIGRPRNQSKDQSLEDDYRTMMRRLSSFIHSAKMYYKSLQNMNAAKQKMSRSLEDLARGYPIADAVFTSSAPKFGEADDITQPSELNSLSRVWKADPNLYSLKFHKKVIQYCIDWQLEVTSRVEGAKKETRFLLSRLAHYLKKVERLRQKSSSATDPKLQRNIRKLEAAWSAHEVKSTQWSYILEEVTVRGWKELYPLLKNILQLEWERVQVEFDQMALVDLPEIEAQLDQLFETACQKVTPVMIDYFAQQQQTQTVVSLSGSCSSCDDEEEEEEDFIEVVLAPKNHYSRDKMESASPKGIADIEYF